jgi:hypothetical protein
MFLIEIGTMDNVQKVVYSNNTPSSQTFRFKILLGGSNNEDEFFQNFSRKTWREDLEDSGLDGG